MIDSNIAKEGSVLAVLVVLFAKVFYGKDTQQNNQNDLFVQHLIDSNKSKDEDTKTLIKELKEISGEFKECIKLMTEELKAAKEDLKEIKELIKNVN
ncbi:hypothetical protein [Cetobacterium sp.]|uniref:hypothetical protein n=1 Tax=Cetobacterium sp. TaxID=2071632 RepID=UPI003EE56E3D